MFINCPSCRALVATDPATDLPPERCPRCAVKLRGQPEAQPVAGDARSGVATAIAEACDGGSATQEDPVARPAMSIATLLTAGPAEPVAGSAQEPEPATGPEHEPTLEPEPEPDPAVEPEAEPAADPEPAAAPEPGPARTGVATGPADDAPSEPVGVIDEAVAPAASMATGTNPIVPTAGPANRARRGPRRAAPEFARRRRRAGRDGFAGRRWPLHLAIAGLALLLALQWLLADRARLAADPGWRPLLAAACAALRCSLPPWHEPGAFVLLERDVRPHPDAVDALRITASFRNDAAWAQPWPEVVLTLSDIDGRPLGMRAFTAAEYLGGAPPTSLLDSGQGAVIRMEVLEPGPGAVGFAFDFH